jgi:hypothetical protein
MTRIATVFALVAASTSAMANDALPAGTWMSQEGPALVQRQGNVFVITDPSDPSLRVVGDVSNGACTMQMVQLNMEVPCTVNAIAMGQVVLTVPMAGLMIPLRYSGQGQQVATGGYPQQMGGQVQQQQQASGEYIIPGLNNVDADTMAASSCWASAGCESYDSGSDTYTYEEPSYTPDVSMDYGSYDY